MIHQNLLRHYPEIISSKFPYPESVQGTGPIKAILLGADPTHIVKGMHMTFQKVFGLEQENPPYFRGIVKNFLHLESLTMKNLFIDNLCRNYFHLETSKNKEWTTIAKDFWIPYHKERWDLKFGADIPVLMTTQFILFAALKEAVPRPKAKDIYKNFIAIQKEDNLLGRKLLALYRHPKYSLKNWPNYCNFLSQQLVP